VPGRNYRKRPAVVDTALPAQLLVRGNEIVTWADGLYWSRRIG